MFSIWIYFKCKRSNDLSEIILICWFAAQIFFLLLSLSKTVFINILVETMMHFSQYV